jgi:two-component system sensor histidine kinase YesM
MLQSHPKRFIPLSYKLLISYLLLVLTPVLVIGFYSYHSSIEAIKQRAENNLQVSMEQMNTNIDYRIADIMRVSNQIFNDQALSRYFSIYYTNMDKYLITTQYILPKIESAVSLPLNPVYLSIYLDKPTISEFYYTRQDDSLVSGRNYSIFHINRVEDASWYKPLRFDFNTILWMQIESDVKFGNISLLRPIIDYESLKSIGFMKITVSLKDIFDSVEYKKLGIGTNLFIVDDSQKPLFISSPIQSEFVSPLNNKTSNYLTMTKKISNFPAQLIAYIPTSSLTIDSNKVRNLTIIVCLLSLIVLSGISFIISRLFSRRMNKLLSSLKAFQEGEFHKRINYRGNDEFSLIADAFNNMVDGMEKLIDEVYISKLQKKEAELQTLQSQINPHFLYNTFSSISRMAKLGETDKLHEMIRSLARFCRLTLNKGDMIITIDKEIQQIQAYIDIQRIKYADRILVEYEVLPSILKFGTVKFILQPFVENVLEHAWFDDLISIRIRGFEEGDMLIFEIIDNGLGMNQETLDQIFNANGTSIGYGIGNVNERIKLHFGKSYGVSIQSRIGEGTTVRITIPIHILKPPAHPESKKDQSIHLNELQ